MADRIVGWRRVPDGSACVFCLACAGAYVKSASAMPLHPRCGCSLDPIIGTEKDFPGETPLPDGVTVEEHGELGPVLGGDTSAADTPWFWEDDEVRVSIAPREAKPGWGRDLSPGEIGAISNYTGGGYKKLNEALREGLELTADQQELKGLLDSAIAKAGTYDEPATVWRGVEFDVRPPDIDLAFKSLQEREALTFEHLADWATEHFPVGETVELGGYQSTSFEFLPALNASTGTKSPGIIFEIRTRTGALLDEYSNYDDEAELLLGENTRYRVRNVLRRVGFEDLDNRYERTVVQLEAL